MLNRTPGFLQVLPYFCFFCCAQLRPPRGFRCRVVCACVCLFPDWSQFVVRMYTRILRSLLAYKNVLFPSPRPPNYVHAITSI